MKKYLSFSAVATIAICLFFGFAIHSFAESVEQQQKGFKVLAYAANDGIYCVSLNNGSNVKLVSGEGIRQPVFSSDRSAIAYLQEDALYVYRFGDQKKNLIAKDSLSFCKGKKDYFYVSTKRNGIVKVDSKQNCEVILAAEKTKDGWIQYEKISVSPDNKLLAFAKRRYVDDRENPNIGNYEQCMGIWICDTSKKTAKDRLKQIQQGDIPVFDFLSNRNNLVYPMPWSGKWSEDSSKLFIWQDVMSGSMHADGIAGSVYDLKTKELIWLNENRNEDSVIDSEQIAYYGRLLPYNENVKFTEDSQLVILNGGGRDMVSHKALQKIKLGIKIKYETLETPGLTPAMPNVTDDGGVIYFAASKSIKGKILDWNKVYPLKRELYAYKEGKIIQLTKDELYTCESPVLSEDETQMIFGRINQTGNVSIWRMNVNGSGLKKLTDLKENINVDYSNYPNNYNDYYGRGSWSDMIAVY